MASPLDRISNLLVTAANPARYDIDGMDSNRCIALHNAILEHGWINSGRRAEEFASQTQTWWSLHGHELDDSRIHPSVRSFLEGARLVVEEPQSSCSFFYNVYGLHHPQNFWVGPGSSMFEDPDMILTSYASHEVLAGTPDGLLYDQSNHNAIMHFDVEDDVVLELERWEKLESILTVWIEMINRQKVVALTADIGHEEWAADPDGNFRLVEGPPMDPVSGAYRLYDETAPWTIQPYTKQDLEQVLETWQLVVQFIEDQMVSAARDEEPTDGLYDTATLDAARIPEGFARSFLLHARKPRFTNIGPGLRISSAQDFADQIFVSSHADPANGLEEDDLPPILLFRNDMSVDTADLGFQWPYAGPSARIAHCPCGLWLDRCERKRGMPFEDGFRLVLPFAFRGWAQKSDSSLAARPDDLLQSGVNPFNQMHTLPLQGFLEVLYMNLRQGHWTIDHHGVAGGIDAWRAADTEASCSNYVIPLGAGEFW